MMMELTRYAKLVGVGECSIMGVSRPSEGDTACMDIWSYGQREALRNALDSAQEALEDALGIALYPRYVSERLPCSHGNILYPRWTPVMAIGDDDTQVALDIPVDYSSEPAVIGPVTLEVVGRVQVMVAGRGMGVAPEDMVMVAPATYELHVPRCKLVLDESNPPGGWDWDDPSLWATSTVSVLVHRTVYKKAEVVAPNCPTQVVDVDAITSGLLRLHGYFPRDEAVFVDVKYLAGYDTPPLMAEWAIIHLAHALLPIAPCGCQRALVLWGYDREMSDPPVPTPWGTSNGALAAWRYVEAASSPRGW